MNKTNEYQETLKHQEINSALLAVAGALLRQKADVWGVKGIKNVILNKKQAILSFSYDGNKYLVKVEQIDYPLTSSISILRSREVANKRIELLSVKLSSDTEGFNRSYFAIKQFQFSMDTKHWDELTSETQETKDIEGANKIYDNFELSCFGGPDTESLR